jgi:hypothetical protein
MRRWSHSASGATTSNSLRSASPSTPSWRSSFPATRPRLFGTSQDRGNRRVTDLSSDDRPPMHRGGGAVRYRPRLDRVAVAPSRVPGASGVALGDGHEIMRLSPTGSGVFGDQPGAAGVGPAHGGLREAERGAHCGLREAQLAHGPAADQARRRMTVEMGTRPVRSSRCT